MALKCLNSTQLQEYCIHIENIILRLWVSASQKEEARQSFYLTHTHDCSEVFVCQQGEVTIKTENNYIHLRSGDTAIIPPGINHVKLHSADDTVNYVISFNCTRNSNRNCTDIYKTISSFARSNKISVFRNRQNLVDYAKNICAPVDSNDTLTPALNMISLLLFASKTSCETNENSPTDQLSAKNIKSDDRGYQLDALISSYYNQKITAKDIALLMHICTRQLDRIVHKIYGKSLHGVFMEQRIKVAEHLLLTTDMNNEQIATEIGFSSTSGFYREFFRQHRLTPNEFRKNRPDNDH